MRYFAANWKMHLSVPQAREYFETFLPLSVPSAERRVLFFPSALAVATARECVGSRSDIAVGAQNIYWEDAGAFTGEISAPMARDSGASFVLIGHSERRHVFGETDAATGRKCAAAVRAGLTPLLCVGERIEEREAGTTEAVVLRQLHAGFAELAPAQIAGSLVAYEPVWAIGTGKTATPADASAVHAVLRAALHDRIGKMSAPSRDVPILYGGSVNARNVAQLLAAPNVDGVLVGGASVDPVGWAAIVAT